jgi:hypothetical protein
MFGKNMASMGGNFQHIKLDGIMMVAFSENTGTFTSVCTLYTRFSEYFQNLYSITQLTAKTSPFDPNFSMIENSTTDSFNNKWHYQRCTFSLKANYFNHMLTTYDQTWNTVKYYIKDIPTFKKPAYYENYYMDNVWLNYSTASNTSTNTVLKIGPSGSISSYSIYLKNLMIFTEMIPNSSKIHYL